MKENKKLLLTLLIGLLLGAACILILQAFNKDKTLEENNPTKQSETASPTRENVRYVIYIDSETSTSEIEDLQNRIKALDINIESLEFKDKEQIRKEELAKLSEEEREKSVLNTYTAENNPLEHMIILSVRDVTDKEELEHKLKIFVNVTDVKY